MKNILSSLLIISMCSLAFGQKKKVDKKQFKGFEKYESGLYFKITEGDPRGAAVKPEDIITVEMTYGTEDTIIMDTKTLPEPARMQISEPMYVGDAMEGMAQMHVGDYAEFKTPADSFFLKVAGVALPDYLESGSYLTVKVKMIKTQTMEEIKAENAAIAEKNKADEALMIQKYIAARHPESKPTASGLYYIETQEGTGVQAQNGKMVSVHYKGTLLSGEVFDSSFERGEPISFQLGGGQVIKGWEEGIALMKVGGRATFIIPSALAYGNYAPPGSIIKPFSPLKFDVELVDVK